MRLKRISLFAIISVLVAGGCSASRHATSSLKDEPVLTPPRHDHEYLPSPSEDDDDFRDPEPRTSPEEPVPAPPALGVSRVKSVGWLRDLGGRRHQGLDESVCGDEELVGRCTPIESCTSEDHGSDHRRERRRSRQSRPTPLAGLRDTLGRVFKRSRPEQAVDRRLMIQRDDVCCGELDPEVAVPVIEHPSEQIPEEQIPAVPQVPSLEHEVNSRQIRSGRKQEILAEPLSENTFDPSLPGLIEPQDIEEDLSDLEIPDQARSSAGRFDPFIPISDVPGINEAPPLPPVLPAPSDGAVDPPLWPRLNRDQGMSTISRSTVVHIDGGPAVPTVMPPKSVEEIKIVPKPRQ